MPIPPLHSLLLLLPPLLGLAIWLPHRRWRRAQAAADALARDLARRNRDLRLYAQELHGLGLALMGQGGEAEPRARALLNLAADMQDTAAAEAGPRALREEPLPLASLLQEVLDQVALLLAPGGRQWHVAPELRDVTLLADRRALRGALTQVLTRAVRHTRDGDPIALRLVRADDTVAIVVEDEGAGLAAEDLGAARPMAGLENPGAAEGTRGLGLGLVVARQLLRAHGGELTVEAVRGVGARAWMTLPRHRLLAAP